MDMPLTDTAPFDESCQYRVDATGSYGRYYYYGTMQKQAGDTVYFTGHNGSGIPAWGWIYSTSKNSADGYLGSINKLQKNCG